MVGGLDRYYQIARCMRDEDLRADRQFEFSQLDLEASFITAPDIWEVVSRAVIAAATEVDSEPPPEVVTMTWDEALDRYGTDKPDLRFGMELVDLADAVAGTEFRAFEAPTVRGIRLPGGGSLGRARLDGLTERARSLGAAGLVWLRVGESSLESTRREVPLGGRAIGDCGRHERRAGRLDPRRRRRPRDVVPRPRPAADRDRPAACAGEAVAFLVGDRVPDVRGPRRRRPSRRRSSSLHDADPLDLDLLESDPLKVRSQAYDLVVNGWELGSGSIRIHRADVQRRVFAALGISDEQAEVAFRIPSRCVQVRGAPARRVRLRDRPARRRPRRRGERPRGDRLSEDSVGLRSDDRCPQAARGETACRARDPDRRPATGVTKAHTGQEMPPRRSGGRPPPSLFDSAVDDELARRAPLAARMRPANLDEVVGQQHLLAPGAPLRTLVEADRLSSAVFYGPPGTGKTSVARLLADYTRRRYRALSAVDAGVKDVRAELEEARQAMGAEGQGTILFLDEVHRFNKAQQDALLHGVEDGLVVLIGATTENPFFALNTPLLSRSTLWRFDPLSEDEVIAVANRALASEGASASEAALDLIADLAAGDARVALTVLEVAIALAGRREDSAAGAGGGEAARRRRRSWTPAGAAPRRRPSFASR